MSKRGYLRSEEKERYWREVLGRHGKGGLSVRSFCRTEGLKESAFYFWKRTISERDGERKGRGKSVKAARSKRRSKSPAATTATFMPLAVVGETSRLEIVLPDGWQVRVTDGVKAQTLCDVVAALRQPAGQETA